MINWTKIGLTFFSVMLLASCASRSALKEAIAEKNNVENQAAYRENYLTSHHEDEMIALKQDYQRQLQDQKAAYEALSRQYESRIQTVTQSFDEYKAAYHDVEVAYYRGVNDVLTNLSFEGTPFTRPGGWLGDYNYYTFKVSLKGNQYYSFTVKTDHEESAFSQFASDFVPEVAIRLIFK